MGQTHFKFHFLNWIFNFQGCFLCLLHYTEPEQGLIQFWPKTLNVLISGRGRKRWEDKSLVGKHESTRQQHWWYHILSSTLLHNISLLSRWWMNPHNYSGGITSSAEGCRYTLCLLLLYITRLGQAFIVWEEEGCMDDTSGKRLVQWCIVGAEDGHGMGRMDGSSWVKAGDSRSLSSLQLLLTTLLVTKQHTFCVHTAINRETHRLYTLFTCCTGCTSDTAINWDTHTGCSRVAWSLWWAKSPVSYSRYSCYPLKVRIHTLRI